MVRTRNALKILREHLQRDGYEPQDRLPPERELAARLDLTRAQIRTAMRDLANEGVLWRHVGRGTFFGTHPTSESAMRMVVRSVNPRELMEARLALEPRLARLAAVSATREDFERMDECLAGSRKARDWRVFQQWDAKLHQTIAESARNTLLLELYFAINGPQHTDVWGKLKQRGLTMERRLEYTRHHIDFVQAMRHRDAAGAESLMRRHLEIVQSRLFPHS